MTTIEDLQHLLHNTENELNVSSIADFDSIKSLLKQVESEIELLEPLLDSLTRVQELLHQAKQKKQRLISLRLSLNSVHQTQQPHTPNESQGIHNEFTSGRYITPAADWNYTFYPDKAFDAAKTLLPRRDSINYELFRGLVFAGGTATTQQLLDYLIEHQIRMPGSGDTFENVGLTHISSRINYLVRKGIVKSIGRGQFRLSMGWGNSSSTN